MEWLLKAFTNSPFAAGSFCVALSAFVFFTWWRQRKSFSYRITYKGSVIGLGNEFDGRVQMLFDGKPVNQVTLMELKLFNTGWVSIEDKDFFVPVSIELVGAEFMTHKITSCEPSDLRAKFIEDGGKLVLEPLLLNRGDNITLKLLVEGVVFGIGVKGRIKGVKRIAQSQTPSYWIDNVINFGSATFMLGFIAIIAIDKLGIKLGWISIAGLYIVVLLVLMMIVKVTRNYRLSKGNPKTEI